MTALWIFWIETLAFGAFLVWSILAERGGAPLTGAQQSALVIYGVALSYTLFHFVRFARKRLAARVAAR